MCRVLEDVEVDAVGDLMPTLIRAVPNDVLGYYVVNQRAPSVKDRKGDRLGTFELERVVNPVVVGGKDVRYFGWGR